MHLVSVSVDVGEKGSEAKVSRQSLKYGFSKTAIFAKVTIFIPRTTLLLYVPSKYILSTWLLGVVLQLTKSRSSTSTYTFAFSILYVSSIS